MTTRKKPATPGIAALETKIVTPAQPQRFALGDVVQLKSGGMAMTVISGGCGETYECAWLPAITADMPRDALGDLPCFYIPGACLKAFVDHDDNIPF